MEATWDNENHLGYIYVKPRTGSPQVHETLVGDAQVSYDYDEDGELIGIEIIAAK